MLKEIGRRVVPAPLRPALGKLYRSITTPEAQSPSTPATLPFLPIPVPDGWTEDDIREVMLSFSLDGNPAEMLHPYVHDALWRFLHSWHEMRDLKGSCLELGANPYFITWLLREFTDLELTLANYFGGDSERGQQTLAWSSHKSSGSATFDFDHFNMEESVFPYDDQSFDGVVYCEIIEHLLMNPVHTLKEIRRVLRTGGRLLITTPNVARIGNVISLIDGRSIYDPYSGFGAYGRHNREYSLAELEHLLKFCGFTIEKSFTADAHPEDWSGYAIFGTALNATRNRLDDLGQYLFIVAEANESPQNGLPASLYRSYPEGELNQNW
jgi:SAM-dependent methyltransferase